MSHIRSFSVLHSATSLSHVVYCWPVSCYEVSRKRFFLVFLRHLCHTVYLLNEWKCARIKLCDNLGWVNNHFIACDSCMYQQLSIGSHRFLFCCCDDWLCLMTTYHHITHHSLMIRIRNFMSNSNRVTFQLEFIWITNSAWEFSSILSFVIDVVWWFSVGSLWERQQSVCEWILFILPTK